MFRGCNGSGFLGSGTQLSHAVSLTDMPELSSVQIQDCSYCKISIQLGQYSQKLLVEVEAFVLSRLTGVHL
jgi:hypothetical protein